MRVGDRRWFKKNDLAPGWLLGIFRGELAISARMALDIKKNRVKTVLFLLKVVQGGRKEEKRSKGRSCG